MVTLKYFIFAICSILPIYGEVLLESAPFSTQYCYYRAQALTQSAEQCFQDFQFEYALDQYEEAHQLFMQSQVSDRFLSFRIELGLSVSEVLKDRDVTMMYRLGILFNKFTSNTPPVKINFETLGVMNVCESFSAAQ